MDKKFGVFDLDGTLIDAYRAIEKTFNYSLEILGYPPVSCDTVKSAVGGGDNALAGKFVRDEDIPKLISLYRENNSRFLDGNVRLLDGCTELLSCLREKGVRLGVATNRAGFSAVPLLEKLKIKEYFDIICTADEVRNPKPHPDMLFKAMEFFGAGDKSELFYSGDMDIDYFAGKNAGIDTYIVPTGSTPESELEKLPDIKLFDNLVALREYLEKGVRP